MCLITEDTNFNRDKRVKIYGEFLKRLKLYEKEVDVAHEVSARECGGLVEPPCF